jgi:cytosine/adenosine deaminase-related metal-dependent hydrolase
VPPAKTDVFTASWILPISSRPLAPGWIAVEQGRITAVGGGAPPEFPDATRTDLGRVVLLPGLVNAHTHLELSELRGLVPPAATMPEWVRQMIRVRGLSTPNPAAIVEAIDEARQFGTCLVGDISNTLATVKPLIESPLSAVVFFEILHFASTEPAAVVADAVRELAAHPGSPSVRCALAAHAPYSVAPALFTAIAREAAKSGGPCAVHLAESPEEIAFLESGTGGWRKLLEDLGAWNGTWVAPGWGAVAYLDRLEFLGPKVIAAHGVQLTAPELRRLAEAGVTVATCPRSNRWTGVGSPPIERFYESGVRVAIGTDSLASSPDLSIWAELSEMRRLAPSVPARRLLESATRQGADALGFGAELGTIENGKRAELLAVTVPDDVTDVEEYLVGGISAAVVRWLESPDQAQLALPRDPIP